MATIWMIILVTFSIGMTYTNQASSFEITKEGCPHHKGCILFPDECTTSSNCIYLVTYVPGNDSIYFEMSAKNDYVAFGFNKDKKMIGTDAVICSKPASGNTVTIGHYTLIRKDKAPSKTNPTPSGLYNTSGEYSSGVIKCRFTRKRKPSSPMSYDLNMKQYLIYARGSVSGGGLSQHTWRSTSTEKQDLTVTADIDEPNRTLIRAHAALMVLAWVGFASVGIFTARYMKTFWGESTVFGLKVWFQVHRSCMTAVVISTLISTILVFVHVGGWSDIGAHAFIGIAVVVLTVVQPTIALFRPHPQASNRYIFNWVHRFIATVAFTLATVNCFLGANVLSEVKGKGFWALLVFVIVYVIVEIGYEVYLHCRPDDPVPSEGFSEMNIQENTTSQAGDAVRKVVYAFLILLAVVICLVFFILLGSN